MGAGCQGTTRRPYAAGRIDRVHHRIGGVVKTLKSDAVREGFATLGAEVWPSTPEQLGQFIKDDLAKWSKVVKAAGIKVE
ncbi:MAG: hypothetical protein EHM59_19565 [Betaproteobacteria bacterium]|nr:MAG: hypothetical protein EHM59_19565 [Betaproteobacteria bacterium]